MAKNIENNITTLTEFRKTRVRMTKEEYEKEWGVEINDHKGLTKYVSVYCHGFHIEEWEDGRFFVPYDREFATTDTRQEAEKIFWDEFASYELGVKEFPKK